MAAAAAADDDDEYTTARTVFCPPVISVACHVRCGVERMHLALTVFIFWYGHHSSIFEPKRRSKFRQ